MSYRRCSKTSFGNTEPHTILSHQSEAWWQRLAAAAEGGGDGDEWL